MAKYGYCPYCGRYIGSGYMACEHKKLCKNATPEARMLHKGLIRDTIDETSTTKHN